MNYRQLSKEELKEVLAQEKKRYEELVEKNLSYDMTRGKPGASQLDLSYELLGDKYIGNAKDLLGQITEFWKK